MIKKNKWKLILASVFTVLPSIVLYIWGSFIEKENTLKDFFAFPISISLFLLVIFWICILFSFYDNEKNEQSEKVINLILWIIPFISILMSVVMLLVSLGGDKYVSNIMAVFLGIVFMVIGNYLPKCKQNRTIGIRIKWTLTNEENWNKTHRFSGFVFTICGVILIVVSFLSEKFIFALFPIVVLVACVASTLYSYLYYKKQIGNGTLLKDDFKVKTNKKFGIISAISITVVLFAAISILFVGNIKTEFKDDAFKISFTLWNDCEISFEDIDAIEYRESGVDGRRIYGFGSPTFLVGKFRNAEFGIYTRYTHTKQKECIVIDIDGEKYVINAKTGEETKTLYEKIKSST